MQAQKIRYKAVIFDLDGVLVDTEAQYTDFWKRVGKVYYPDDPDFAVRIKGQALENIFSQYFSDSTDVQKQLREDLSAFEAQMNYTFMPGAGAFVRALRREGVRTAVVTSSDRWKMAQLLKQHPGFDDLFDRLFTAEDAERSKPAPDCYLNAMSFFGTAPEACVVFEDSLNGLKAARASGAAVVGLSTTLPQETVAQYSDYVMADFTDITPASLRERLAE